LIGGEEESWEIGQQGLRVEEGWRGTNQLSIFKPKAKRSKNVDIKRAGVMGAMGSDFVYQTQ